MRTFRFERFRPALRAALAATAALGLCATATAQPRTADLEIDLVYLVRDAQGLESAGEEARAAFDRALADFENRLKASPAAGGRVWAGLDWLDRRLGRTEQAEAAWRRAREAGYRGPRAETAADLVRPSGERSPGAVGRISLAAASDSNPTLLGETLAIFGQTFPVLAGGDEVRADQSDDLARGELQFALHPVFDRGGWTAGLEGSLGASRYQDLSAFDRSEVRAVLDLAHGGDPAGFLTGPLGSIRVPRRNGRVGVLLQVGAAQDLLDGERHVRSVEGAGGLVLREGPHAATRLELRRAELDLARLGTDVGGAAIGDFTWTEMAAGLVQSLFLGRGDRVLRLGVSTGERAGERRVDGSFVSGSAALDLLFARRWGLFLAAEVRNDDYDHGESNPFWRPDLPAAGFKPRDETTWRASARLVRELPGGLRFTASVAHENRDAEPAISVPDPDPTFVFDPLSYDRTVVALGIGWRFGREGTP